MKYNELPHVLAHNKKEASKHKGETIASLRVELATLRAQNAELLEALEKIRDVAHGCIGYVTAANYPERATKAHNNLNKAFDEAIEKVKHVTN